MTEMIAGVLALAAGVFAVIAAIGLLRFPDMLSRMHAASKVGTFAGGLALMAVAVGVGSSGSVVKAVIALLFLFLTAPIAAHLIGRAAAWRNGALRRDRS